MAIHAVRGGNVLAGGWCESVSIKQFSMHKVHSSQWGLWATGHDCSEIFEFLDCLMLILMPAETITSTCTSE